MSEKTPFDVLRDDVKEADEEHKAEALAFIAIAEAMCGNLQRIADKLDLIHEDINRCLER